MPWLIIYLTALSLPILILAAWELIEPFRSSRTQRRGPHVGKAPAIDYSGVLALEAAWVAVRAQFLVAPGRGLAEAAELLQLLAPDSDIDAVAAAADGIAPAIQMRRLEWEFDRAVSRLRPTAARRVPSSPQPRRP